MGNAVVHFEVMAQDKAKTTAFFSELFGWKINTDNPIGYGVIAHSDNYSQGGVGIGGGIFGDMPKGQDGVTFYVQVDDVETTLAQAERLGGKRLMGPETTEGGPTFGHILDPEGHWVGLFQKGSGDGAAKIAADAAPKGSPVVHFEVIGKDYATLSDFYGQLFGWKPNADNPMNYGVIAREDNLSTDGIGIGGGLMGMPPEMLGHSEGGHSDGGDSNGHVTWYVEVPDVETALVKAESLGGQRLNGPDTVPGGGPTLGQFADPEGHLIGLVQAGSM
jgi:predicted enzyme related to lactoylglutathione lyase